MSQHYPLPTRLYLYSLQTCSLKHLQQNITYRFNREIPEKHMGVLSKISSHKTASKNHHMNIYIYTHIYIYINIYIYIYTYTYTYTHTHIHIYHIHTYIHTCTHTYIHTYMHTYMCVYVHCIVFLRQGFPV